VQGRRGRRRRGAGAGAAIVLLAAVLAGCAGQVSSRPERWFAAHGGTAPSADRVYVCHAFGCARRTAVDIGPADWRRLTATLRAGQGSPAAERKAIAEAVAWLERRVAPTVGSAGDVGGLDLANSGTPGQLDCIDEATNTTSYLLVLEKRGLLVHHRVAAPVARGFFLDGRYPHATAVIVEKRSGETFAVDSWTHDNGVLPDVMPLDRWFATWPAYLN